VFAVFGYVLKFGPNVTTVVYYGKIVHLPGQYVAQLRPILTNMYVGIKRFYHWVHFNHFNFGPDVFQVVSGTGEKYRATWLAIL
jgi:hypothetical protein